MSGNASNPADIIPILSCLQRVVKEDLIRLGIVVNPTKLHQILSLLLYENLPQIIVNPVLLAQFRRTVEQCAAMSNATEHSIVEYLSGVITEEKLVHLMHCSCQCRQLWRVALKDWIIDAPDSTPCPQPPACRCCDRHQQYTP
jgi:hypothetical protein